MRYVSHPEYPPHAGSGASFNRLVSVGTGGAMLGASLAGPVGAAIGGLVGLVFAESANRAERDRADHGSGASR